MRAMRLVLLLFTAGRASADGFHAGDAWRGTMTNCQQSPHMLRRAVRYVAIELSVLAVDDRKVEVQFQNHAQKDMSYKLHPWRVRPVAAATPPPRRADDGQFWKRMEPLRCPCASVCRLLDVVGRGALPRSHGPRL